MEKMKLGNAAGLDGMSVEAWKVLMDRGVKYLAQLLNRVKKD